MNDISLASLQFFRTPSGDLRVTWRLAPEEPGIEITEMETAAIVLALEHAQTRLIGQTYG